MLPGVPERRSFDYIRHGTVDLIDRQTEAGLAVHVITEID